MEMFIGGGSVASRSGRRMPVINPVNGEAFDDVPLATAEDVDHSEDLRQRAGWKAPGTGDCAGRWYPGALSTADDDKPARVAVDADQDHARNPHIPTGRDEDFLFITIGRESIQKESTRLAVDRIRP